MPLTVVHDRIADAAAIFVAALAIWALIWRIRSRPLDGNWYGAAVVGELLIAAQCIIGVILYFQGLGASLPRPFMHILYGIVAVITLPAAYGYLGQLKDEGAKSLGMAFICFFLWGIVLRASSVAQYLPLPQ